MSSWFSVSLVLVPTYILIAFFFVRRHTNRIKIKKRSAENFVVEFPEAVAIIGLADVLVFTVMTIGVTIAEGHPHYLLYVCMALFLVAPLHVIKKTWSYRVVVQNNTLTVFSAFRKSYVLTFDEIKMAKRRTSSKYQKVETETTVIKTTSGRRFVIDCVQIKYIKLLDKIQKEVPAERLIGFTQTK